MKPRIHILTVLILAAALALAATPATADQSKPCPWKISSVGIGKWANGNHKSGIWLKGSFPINIPGVTERPDWSINGSNVGKSQIHFNQRWIPNASSRLMDGAQNTVTVTFQKPPYNGASNSCTVTIDWDDVPRGGYKYYRCQ